MKDHLKSVDIFDKYDNDNLYLTTKCGYTVTNVFGSILLFIFVIQIISFAIPKVINNLAVDEPMVNRQEKVAIYLSIFVDMPCFFLHLDNIDSIGTTQTNLNGTNTVLFHRYSSSGKEIGIASESLKYVCHSCRGLLPENICCNSCNDIKMAYLRTTGIIPADIEQSPQCRADPTPTVKHDEKCLIDGHFDVNQVNGWFHVGLGKNLLNQPGHVHEVGFTFPNIRMSHTINYVRFGQKLKVKTPGIKDASNWISSNFTSSVLHQNLLFVTPVIVQKNSKSIQRGFQYSSISSIRTGSLAHVPPQINFVYSFTPYTVILSIQPRSILRFFSSTFGLLAGIYAIAQFAEVMWTKRAETHAQTE